MISTMKTMFQGWFRAVSTGVCPYHQKSDFLSIMWISALLIIHLHAESDRFHAAPKKCQHLIYLVKPERGLALLQFTDKAKANTSSVSQILLCQPHGSSTLFDE
jgi:hypothetical protein